jgi:myo-inositol-1(or 4)-monophosphatase
LPELLAFVDRVLRLAADRLRALPEPEPVECAAGHDRNQVVTEADRVVGDLLAAEVRAAFPDAGIVNEEGGAAGGDGDLTWILDPVDGTSNYAAGSPLFGIMLAAVRGGAVLAGGVALPAFDELYLAEAGHGAYRNGARLRLPSGRPLSQQLVAYGLDVADAPDMAPDWRLLAGLAAACRGIRSSNSVFDAVLVARGAYGALLHRAMRIWDVAPIAVLVSEAGGECTDLHGAALRFDAPAGRRADVYPVRCCQPGLGAELDAVIAAADVPRAATPRRSAVGGVNDTGGGAGRVNGPVQRG